MNKIEYRDIPGFPGYRAGSDGSVWSSWTYKGTHGDWKRLRGRTNKDGYIESSFRSESGIRKTCRFHRLVLLAFRGESDLETRHLNGIRIDNRLENLEYGTSYENHLDQIAHGKTGVGEKNGRAKLNQNDVLRIKHLASTGMTRRSLSRLYGVIPATINKIIWGVTWKHLPDSIQQNLCHKT